MLVVVKLFYPKRAASQKTCLLKLVPNCQSEHPLELPNRIRPVTNEHLQYHFGIGMRLEALTFVLELGTERTEVINLAVEGYVVAPVRRRHRLMPGLAQIEDRETGVDQASLPPVRNKYAPVIRASMMHLCLHLEQLCFELFPRKVRVNDSRYAAHTGKCKVESRT